MRLIILLKLTTFISRKCENRPLYNFRVFRLSVVRVNYISFVNFTNRHFVVRYCCRSSDMSDTFSLLFYSTMYSREQLNISFNFAFVTSYLLKDFVSERFLIFPVRKVDKRYYVSRFSDVTKQVLKINVSITFQRYKTSLRHFVLRNPSL